MKIQENIPLAPFTTFKIGGPARFFCEAKSEDEILEALEFAQEKKLSVFVLGGGSNVLVSDKGFEGVAIRLCNSQLEIGNLDIACGSGCQLSKVVSESVKSGLTGLEWAAGIPGTIGAAVRGNAGAFGGTMGDAVENVKAFEISNFQFSIFKNKDCKFDYRDSIFKQNRNLLITSITLKLKKGNKAESEKKIKEILAARKEKQPRDPSPGSFFKNPVVKDKELIKQFETDTGQKVRDGKIPAPWLIEEVGLKGKKIGGAMISEKHANFIVNTGSATADNVLTLVAMAKTRVRDRFDIQLDEEVQFVGF